MQRGYATASTDTGHEGGSASFALGHPEKLIDYGYRAVHEMTVKSKAIIAAYYGKAAKLSYWNGCSAGGKQGLKEAQRYPEDFDAIIAGAPANNWTGRAAHALWIAQAVHSNEASYIPPSKYPLIHNAVLEACDARDGVKDGIVDDPTRCQFDPEVLACKGADSSACLTAPQVEAARRIYSGVANSRTKEQIFPGLEPGSELGWAVMARAAGVRDRAGTFQVRGVQRSELGLSDAQLRQRHRARRESGQRHHQCDRSESEAIFRARRKAAAISRLERLADRAAEQRQLLQDGLRTHWAAPPK